MRPGDLIQTVVGSDVARTKQRVGLWKLPWILAFRDGEPHQDCGEVDQRDVGIVLACWQDYVLVLCRGRRGWARDDLFEVVQ